MDLDRDGTLNHLLYLCLVFVSTPGTAGGNGVKNGPFQTERPFKHIPVERISLEFFFK